MSSPMASSAGAAGSRADEPVEDGFLRALADALSCDARVGIVALPPGRPVVAACLPDDCGDAAVQAAGLATSTADHGPVVRLRVDDGHALAARITSPDGAPCVLVALTGGCAPSDEDVRILGDFGGLTRTVLQCIREREGARMARDRMQSLVEAGMAITSSQDLRTVLMRLADAARSIIGARYAAIGVVNETRDGLRDFITSGISDDVVRQIGAPPRGRGILGLLIDEARPLRLKRLSAHEKSVGFPSNHPPMKSFLGVPVALGEEVFGNLYLTEKLSGGFSDEDEALAITLAAQAAVAIDVARRYEFERLRAAELESIQEVGSAILQTLELDALLPLVARRARGLIGADTVAVGLIEGGHFGIRFAEGQHGAELGGLWLRTGDDTVGDALREAAGSAHCELSWLTVGGRRVGVLAALGARAFGEAERRVLHRFSTQAAIAVVNATTYADERSRLAESVAVAAARERSRLAEEGLRRAIAAQESERMRIARELHDETGQVLTALAVQLRALEHHVADDTGRDLLAELRAQINSASSGLRSLATELRPSGLREHGLVAAIERHAARVQEASGIPVDLAVADLDGSLSEEIEIAIFRVVQEALINVARHSGAGRASVLARVRGLHLRIVVEDDGCGFAQQVPTGHLGIAGMRERMDLVGGTLRVESIVGEGTTVILDLDMDGRGAVAGDSATWEPA